MFEIFKNTIFTSYAQSNKVKNLEMTNQGA